MNYLREGEIVVDGDNAMAFQSAEYERHTDGESIANDLVKAANGCDAPCPYGTFYHCCVGPGPHDGAHYCDQGHRW